MLKLIFYISESQDGTLYIEPHDIHYCFRDDLCYDNVPADRIYKVMQFLRKELEMDNLEPVFQLL